MQKTSCHHAAILHIIIPQLFFYLNNASVTGTFSLIAVSCFGCLWPSQFYDVFNITASHLGYSFYFTIFSVPLTYIAGAGILVDFRSSWSDLQAQFHLVHNQQSTIRSNSTENVVTVRPDVLSLNSDHESRTLLNSLEHTTPVWFTRQCRFYYTAYIKKFSKLKTSI